MSTPATTHPGQASNGVGQNELGQWTDRTRVVLRPISPPSILGLFGFAASTFIVAAYLAGWYGGEATPEYLFPFALVFGGIAQFAAGMWSFVARDAVATAVHGMWGSFWIAFGILQLLVAVGTLSLTSQPAVDAFGYWFFALAVLTGICALAATFDNLAVTIVLVLLTVGAAFLGIGYTTASTPEAGSGFLLVGGYVLIGSAIAAAYTGGAMMIAAAAGRVVLPMGNRDKRHNIPGRHVGLPIEFHGGEPGVKHGQ